MKQTKLFLTRSCLNKNQNIYSMRQIRKVLRKNRKRNSL